MDRAALQLVVAVQWAAVPQWVAVRPEVAARPEAAELQWAAELHAVSVPPSVANPTVTSCGRGRRSRRGRDDVDGIGDLRTRHARVRPDPDVAMHSATCERHRQLSLPGFVVVPRGSHL